MTRFAATVETEAGLQAPVTGRPHLGELPYSTRVATNASAAFDVALRTAVASALIVPGASGVLRLRTRGERRRLAFYRELAEAADPHASFPAPEADVTVTTHPPARVAFRPVDGRVELLRFDSPYLALHPDLRACYARFEHNRVACAQHWRHDDGPRPTLVVIHGFGASPSRFNSWFFALPRLYAEGYDLLLATLPFHGDRQPRQAPFGGWGLFAHGVAHFNEALAHGVHDLRILIDHLRQRGVEQVGVTGLSLGGYVTALLAAVDEHLAVAIPNAPVSDIRELARQWFPASAALAGACRFASTPRAELDAALAFHSPLTYEPLIAPHRRVIIGGLGDRLAPPQQSEALWEHWGRCRLHWFPGSHLLHLSRGVYQREMLRFMRDAGFGVPA